tara:strand:- start:593 stop:814 length:222 start_codon:yes stop_codon:yes gene_type:complete
MKNTSYDLEEAIFHTEEDFDLIPHKEKTNQPKETMKKEIITILKTAINLIEEKNDLDFVLFFINKSFKKMGVK